MATTPDLSLHHASPGERDEATPMAVPPPLSSSSVLFQSADRSTVLLDIPRSLEEAQVAPGHAPERRIYSAPPPDEPFRTPEPRDGGGEACFPSSASAATQVADLMTGAAVQSALQELAAQYTGPFHASRLVPPEVVSPAPAAQRLIPVPPGTECLCGSVQDLRHVFRDTAPKFDLVVLDPPWPNRSARRKTQGYATAATLEEIRQLLGLIPVDAHLELGGLVAVWITNKPSIISLLTCSTGVFASWGVELVAEWTWLKVTTLGEPLFDIDSRWRKPWEKLLIARRTTGRVPTALRPKVIIGVPDVHSRKPNLRGLFQEVLGDDYRGLEIFSRSLTAGWWCWGDEALRFQDEQHWVSTEASE